MAFLTCGGSYMLPPEVTGLSSAAPVFFTAGEVLDHRLDPAPDLHACVVFRSESSPLGPDGAPR
jgi:hypothetical protein